MLSKTNLRPFVKHVELPGTIVMLAALLHLLGCADSGDESTVQERKEAAPSVVETPSSPKHGRRQEMPGWVNLYRDQELPGWANGMYPKPVEFQTEPPGMRVFSRMIDEADAFIVELRTSRVGIDVGPPPLTNDFHIVLIAKSGRSLPTRRTPSEAFVLESGGRAQGGKLVYEFGPKNGMSVQDLEFLIVGYQGVYELLRIHEKRD